MGAKQLQRLGERDLLRRHLPQRVVAQQQASPKLMDDRRQVNIAFRVASSGPGPERRAAQGTHPPAHGRDGGVHRAKRGVKQKALAVFQILPRTPGQPQRPAGWVPLGILEPGPAPVLRVAALERLAERPGALVGMGAILGRQVAQTALKISLHRLECLRQRLGVRFVGSRPPFALRLQPVAVRRPMPAPLPNGRALVLNEPPGVGFHEVRTHEAGMRRQDEEHLFLFKPDDRDDHVHVLEAGVNAAPAWRHLHDVVNRRSAPLHSAKEPRSSRALL